MPPMTMLLCFLYYPNENSLITRLLSRLLHPSFSCSNLSTTVSFMLITSSFKQLIFIILFSTFAKASSFKINFCLLLLQPFTKYLRLTLVSMWNSALQESLISVFQEFFASIDNIISAGRMGTRLSFYEV